MFSDQSHVVINRILRAFPHLKLTVGVLQDGRTDIRVFTTVGEQVNPPEYLYQIGSITKVFTTSLLAKLVSSNQVKLDDPISVYLEGLEPNRYYPTLRRLATHNAGYSAFLPYSFAGYIKLIGKALTGSLKDNPLWGRMTREDMLYTVNSIPLADREYRYQYSNFGYGVLGHTLANVLGGGFDEIMNAFLQDDLGMRSSYVGLDTNRNLIGYTKKNQPGGNWNWPVNDIISPAGAISASAADLLHFASLNLDGTLPYLSLCHDVHGEGTGRYRMGLGWELPRKRDVMERGGGAGSFTSNLVLSRAKRKAVVVLSNYPINTIAKVSDTFV